MFHFRRLVPSYTVLNFLHNFILTQNTLNLCVKPHMLSLVKCMFLLDKYITVLTIFFVMKICCQQARSRGGSGESADPPLENQRSTFWNLAREIIKANDYKWLTIYLKFVLLFWPWVSLPSLFISHCLGLHLLAYT